MRLAPGESKQRLRLPKRLKAGTYAVKIAFKATRSELVDGRDREGGVPKGALRGEGEALSIFLDETWEVSESENGAGRSSSRLVYR